MDTQHEFRRRVASSHHRHHNEQVESGGVRVVSCSSAAPRGNARPYTQRKPVTKCSSDEEVNDRVKTAEITRASHSVLETNAVPCHPSTATVQSLLPSPFDERETEDKARWLLDQPIHDEDQYIANVSCVESSQLEPTEANDCHSHQAALVSPSSATITLEGIARSLQWTQRFPQGLHFSRVKSRTALHGTCDDSSAVSTYNGKEARDMLAEVRSGLRMLAKRREDILEESDRQPSSRLAKWNSFKWALFLSTLIVLVYGTIGLVVSLLTWADAWEGAQVSLIMDRDLVICG